MGKYSRSITHATETSHDVLTIRCCLFAFIYGERFSLELTDGRGGGERRGYGIFNLKYPISLFSVFNRVANLVYFALNRVKIAEFQQLAQPQKNFL